MAKAKPKTIPTLSLFSGAGGLDIGFIQAGYEIKACVEIEPAYAATLKANQSWHGQSTVVHCQDIRSFDARPYHRAGIRCVIGGPPCQTFSAAGRRSGGVIGLEDERGQLFRAYCRILSELQPEVFVFENVYGLPGANGGGPWRDILAAFTQLGYVLRAEVLDAADYGVAQHRERLIMVGHRVGEYEFPLPTHGPDSGKDVHLLSVERAIRDLQPRGEPYHDNLGGMYGHLLPLVPEGLNYAYFTAEMGHPEPVFAWRSKFHDLLYKVSRDNPCRTIKAQPGKFTGPFHWKNRHFTIPELKRLQSFPDDYNIVGSYAKVLEQIGNSVPPGLAGAIATSVREQLFDTINRKSLPIRPPGFKSTFRQRQRARSEQFALIARDAIKRQHPTERTGALVPGPLKEAFSLNPLTMFDRTRYQGSFKANPSLPLYQVAIAERGRHLEVGFRNAIGAGSVMIEISGMRKYIPDFDSLRLTGVIATPDDAFHLWGVIEEVLTKRSRFFSLIDIYGHYANRGDTVKVEGEWRLNGFETMSRALNAFSSSQACGDFVDEGWLIDKLKLTTSVYKATMLAMRGIRFDLRTYLTHPIIGGGRVLCTYPFPLLSPRALVESRVRMISSSQSASKPNDQLELT